MSILASADFVTDGTTVTNLALLPGFLDPVNLLNGFGSWVLVGLLIVVLVESGLPFPVLPGDSLLFTAGLIAASKSADIPPFAPLWVLMVSIPIAAIIGGQIGYGIGRFAGVELFSPTSRFFKQKYLDESHAFFEKHGAVTILLARFVPIVRTFAPIVAGASNMKLRLFTVYNVIGAIVWGAGVTLLGFLLGQIQFIRDNVDLIFVVIVLLSVVPIMVEVGKRMITARKGEAQSSTVISGDDEERIAAPRDPDSGRPSAFPPA